MNEKNENITFSNQNYNNQSALQIRLDTKELLENLKLSLSGKYPQAYGKEDGTIGIQVVSIGEPRCNDKGLQALTSFVSNFINTQVVQGNFIDEEMYYLQIDYLEDSLRSKLIINAPYWDIRDEEIKGIYDEILALVSMYLSRLLFNEERGSYADTIRTTENNTISNGNNGFFPFKK